MYGGDRNALREVFLRAWGHHQRGEPLAGIEQIVVQVALAHPEYHALLADPDSRERDYPPALDQTNPFLHLSLHIAVEEQLSIDQPPGVRRCYQELRRRLPDDHAVQHAVMECLTETLWQAQRAGGAPDDQAYLACLTRRTGMPDRSET